MKALRLESIGELRELELPAPVAGDAEVVVRTRRCALCRTDLKMWQTGQRDLILPRILGHEFVVELEGRCHAVWPGVACGACRPCRDNRENLCRRLRILGFHRDGGLAEYVLVPRDCLLPLPADLDLASACLAEPLACGVNGLEQAGVGAGQSVLIYGAGRVGLLTALAAAARGADVYVCDCNPTKLERAAPWLEALQIRSGVKAEGRAFDAALNAAPAVETAMDGLPRLRAGGIFCLFSGLPGLAKVPAALLNEVHYRQLQMVGAYGCTRSQMQSALLLLAENRALLPTLIERRIRLAEVEAAFTEMQAGLSFSYVVIPSIDKE